MLLTRIISSLFLKDNEMPRVSAAIAPMPPSKTVPKENDNNQRITGLALACLAWLVGFLLFPAKTAIAFCAVMVICSSLVVTHFFLLYLSGKISSYCTTNPTSVKTLSIREPKSAAMREPKSAPKIDVVDEESENEFVDEVTKTNAHNEGSRRINGQTISPSYLDSLEEALIRNGQAEPSLGWTDWVRRKMF